MPIPKDIIDLIERQPDNSFKSIAIGIAAIADSISYGGNIINRSINRCFFILPFSCIATFAACYTMKVIIDKRFDDYEKERRKTSSF